jgi:integrase
MHIERRTAKDGSISFRAKVNVVGFPSKSATFERKSEARDWANTVEGDMRAGRYGADTLARKYPAGKMIRRYLRTVLTSKTTNKRTIEAQRSQLEWWEEKLRDVLLINLTPYLINDLKDELSETLSPATVNRYLAALNHVINTAIKQWGWMSANPIEKIEKPKEPKGRSLFLTKEQCTALLAACKLEKRKPLYLIVLFALCTGARKSEILTLKRKDVDLIRKVAVAYDTKNGENRPLYLWDGLCLLLADYLMRGSKSRFVFASRTGGILNIEVEWRRALKRAGITGFRFHDLRHTAASYMAMNGAPPSDVGEALGHKDPKQTKRYSHLSTTHVGNVVRGMNQNVFGQMIEGARA